MSQPTAGPPGGTGAPGYDAPEDGAGVEPEKYFAVGQRRRLIGYWVGALAVIFVGVVLLVAQSEDLLHSQSRKTLPSSSSYWSWFEQASIQPSRPPGSTSVTSFSVPPNG